MKTLTKTGLILIVLLAFTITLPAQEIFDAVRKGDLAKVKELVEKDPQLVKARDRNQTTPLHIAADMNNEAISKFLIEKGADLNAVNRNYCTPLFYAGLDVVKILVEKGANINFDSTALSALDWAAMRNKNEVVDYLIDHGAKLPAIETNRAKNSLARMLKLGNVKYLEKFLQQGLSPLYESESKSTLLHFAAESNSTELVNRIIDLGAPLNKTNLYGWTPLHSAAYRANKSIVELLIQKGLDKNLRTIDGSSPYNLAVEAKKDDIINYLKSVGADQNPQQHPKLTGEFMGQLKPGKKAVPFAPGIVGVKNSFHGSITFSPDGDEAYWSVYNNKFYNFLSKRVNGKWTLPDTVASISTGDSPFISPDGNKLYFLRTAKFQGNNKEIIYVCDKNSIGWSKPYPLPDIINSVPGIHFQLSVDSKNNLYFGTNGRIIYCSEFIDGSYSAPKIIESLKEISAFAPFISPDGSYLLISENIKGLAIFFKKKDGTWTRKRSISEIIGTYGDRPIVSWDGKYLFFLKEIDDTTIPFWVDASFIEDLRKEALKDDK